MPAHFDLFVTVDAQNHTAEFSLQNDHGAQIAYRYTDFKRISVSHRRGLFDLRNYLRLFVERGRESTAMAEIGVCIAEEVLGQDIFLKLWDTARQRTLRVVLPGAEDAENYLAAALARVPWEIARPNADAASLGERNLLVRVVYDMESHPPHAVDLGPDEPLRVLFVFAEARGSRPLAVRQERRALLRLFNQEIYPRRRIVAHFLTHGVTRERLVDQIQRNDGYHVVHWSGHGHLNLLELARPGGAKDYLSGHELLKLFHDAGGLLPQLMFLSACHSGDILQVRDWNDFLAVAQGNEPDIREVDVRDLDLKLQPGFTGTAHALLQGGVPSVVAMRYAVGDDYARNLAVAFYSALFAHDQPKYAAVALTQARNRLMNSNDHDAVRFGVCDHATPVLYGAEQPVLPLVRGRSPEASLRDPRLHRVTELAIASHEHFVGRTWELAGLGSDFIGSSGGAEVRPVAVIVGLGGMGKTALVAETLDLWGARFDRVLLYQAKPNALGFEATLRDIHQKLIGELGHYHDHLRQWPADAIHREPSAEFTGPERVVRLIGNLVRALRDEAILLVLDNFETNLKPMAEPVVGQPVWACQDASWDACLKALATDLVGSPSRVLITSRKPLAALADGLTHSVLLGPLPPSEAALYLRAHPALGKMAWGGDEQERGLAQRLLNASRFHPLLMDRLARLAAAPERRAQLLEALETLEKTKDFAGLPALFAISSSNAKELAYLDDALEASLDQLIHQASADARCLLWIIAVANDPVAFGLLKSVWNGPDFKQEQLQTLKRMLDMPSSESQVDLTDIPPDVRSMLAALPEASVRPDIEPLLCYLVSVGLVTEERMGPEDNNPVLSCHELVRERIRAWMMRTHDHDRNELTEDTIRIAYADRLAAYFRKMHHHNTAAAIDAGQRALVYCIQAEEWERLGGFASQLITSIHDQRLIEALIPHLQTAAESAPEGRTRWRCMCYLADALLTSGRSVAALPFYARAAVAARTAAEAGGGEARQAWSDLGWISGNWANACADNDDLDAARQHHLESAEAEKNAGSDPVRVVGSELEALRIDIMQDQVETALPMVEERLAQVRQWWDQYRTDQALSGDTDAEALARSFISALDIARQAHAAQEDWHSALRRLDDMLEVERWLERSEEDIGTTRYSRANVLIELERLGEAREELEDCLRIFQDMPAISTKVYNSLAQLFAEQGDLPQAIVLQRRALAQAEQLPDSESRAISHSNLAISLNSLGSEATLVEARMHQLAGLVYRFALGFNYAMRSSLRNYVFEFRRAYESGTTFAVPRVSELLTTPAFASLNEWLLQRQVDVEALQAEVDTVLEHVRQVATQPE